MKYILLILLSLGIIACDNVDRSLDRGVQEAQGTGETILRLKVGGVERRIGTKTILSGDNIETDVMSVTLAAYDEDGVLSSVKYYESGSSVMKLDLVRSISYNVYALANMGDMTEEFPFLESDVPEIEYMIPSFDDVNAKGIPMCGTVTVEGKAEATVELERLFAKLKVKILHGRLYDANPETPYAYNMCNKSIYLRQANKRMMPFATKDARADRLSDVMEVSDYNHDMNDRTAYDGSLSQGQLGPGPGYFQDTTLIFYVPENMQGDLLPDNDDPAAKVYESIDGINGKPYGDLCTYVEFNARREETQGYGGSVMYRCYLGEDSTSDFSVRRNCIYELTMDFTEDGFFLDSWKVTPGDDWTDNRCLRFVDKSYTVNPGETRNVMVHFHKFTSSETHSLPHPERWRYIIDEEAMADAGLSVSFDPYTLVAGKKYNDFCLAVTASADAQIGTSFPMTVMTTDGSIVDHATISVVPESELNVEWDFCPEYISQYGGFTVKGYDDGDLPLSYSVSDGTKISCSFDGTDSFRVVAKNEGKASVTVSNADGSKTVTAYISVWAPELVLDMSRIELNPDGRIIPVGYEYRSMSGETLVNVDEEASKALLKPSVTGSGYFVSDVGDGSINFHIGKLNHDGVPVSTGGVYTLSVAANGCDAVSPKQMKVFVVDPFGEISTRDAGIINDYTLFSMSDASTGLADRFAAEIQANSVKEVPCPVPAADPSLVSVELVPMWAGKFSAANGTYSLSRNSSTGLIKVIQNNVTQTTSHSAGVHQIVMSVANRHSGEKLNTVCAKVSIYVHTAIGAEAVFGKQYCGYKTAGIDKSFADIYNKVAGRNIYQDPNSSRDINYVDVTMKWLTPVNRVHVLNMACAPNDSYDGLKFIQPMVEDGQQNGGQLFSVCRIGGDDRISVCGEPAGSRAGAGRLLYRSLLQTTYDRVLSKENLHEFFFNYKGTSSGLIAPAYKAPDTARFKDGAYYFAPSSCSEYVDEDKNGYHVIHFLEDIYPETAGWINLIK